MSRRRKFVVGVLLAIVMLVGLAPAANAATWSRSVSCSHDPVWYQVDSYGRWWASRYANSYNWASGHYHERADYWWDGSRWRYQHTHVVYCGWWH